MRPVLLAVAALVAATLLGCSDDATTERTITMRFTKFNPEVITVRAGDEVTFELRNDDPIEHEFMIGDAEFHKQHRTGTHAFHDEVPDEVTVPALETRTTVLRFDEPGEYEYICHLPGHEEYGMKGVLRVVAN